MIGFYNVIKPTGVSSGYVVNFIKHCVKEKVGHLGTLDPLASGVLPVAVGKATRVFDYFLKKDKEYFALMKLGVETTTLDSEGEVKARGNTEFETGEVQKAANSLIGEIMQKPPIFSAVQIGGARAYDVAKQNPEMELAARKTQIYSINVEKWHQNGIFTLKIHCSAGTYVRSIVRDIAAKLGTVATAVVIIRTKSGAFDIAQSHLLEDIKKDPEGCLISVNSVLKLKEIELSDAEAKDLANGKEVATKEADGEYLCLFKAKEFSLARAESGRLKNKIFFYSEGVK